MAQATIATSSTARAEEAAQRAQQEAEAEQDNALWQCSRTNRDCLQRLASETHVNGIIENAERTSDSDSNNDDDDNTTENDRDDMDEIMDNGVDTASSSKGRHMCAYMPPDGTPIYEYLDGIKRKVKRGFINVRTGPMFVPPP
jgi:hypothetical protein